MSGGEAEGDTESQQALRWTWSSIPRLGDHDLS